MTSVGCYSIGESIGEGTYGKVRLGVHQLTGQRVAIKKISKQHAPLMAREIHNHRLLYHPNIVTLYEVLMTESSIHIISEYCPNGELFDMLTRCGRFSERQTQRWFLQLVDAVLFCHSHNIIHRDLKLENILLDAEYNAKLCDFGFARQAEKNQMLGTFCGSLAYSAPEVIRRQNYTGPETDVWSLGVILYTLLAGELPFDDDNEIIIERKIVGLDYSIPSYFSPETADLVHRMLKLKPSDRISIDSILAHPWLSKSFDDEEDDFDRLSPQDTSYSDLDSIFSDPQRPGFTKGDTLTDASSYDDRWSAKDTFNALDANYLTQETTRVHSARALLQTMHADDRALSRHSAPISTKKNGGTFNRVSLPPLPSLSLSTLPSYSPSHAANQDTAMTPIEYQLFTALRSAGFDEIALRRMRSKHCDAPGTLWQMLLTKLGDKNSLTVVLPLHQEQDAWPRQTRPESGAANTSYSECTARPSPGLHHISREVDAQEKEKEKEKGSCHPKTDSSLAQQSPPSLHNPRDKTGWLTSVKSWFGTHNKHQEPLPDQKIHLEPITPPLSVENNRTLSLLEARSQVQAPSQAWTHDLAISMSRHRYGSQKHRRHLLQLSSPPISELDQFTYSTTSGESTTPSSSELTKPLKKAMASKNPRQTLYSTKASNITVPSPVLITPKMTTDMFSIVTTPPYISMTGVPVTVTEIDLCSHNCPIYSGGVVKKSMSDDFLILEKSNIFKAPASPSSIESLSTTCTDSESSREDQGNSSVSSPASSINEVDIETEKEKGEVTEEKAVQAPEPAPVPVPVSVPVSVPVPVPVPVIAPTSLSTIAPVSVPVPVPVTTTLKITPQPPPRRFELLVPRLRPSTFVLDNSRQRLGSRMIIEEEEEDEE
ncbi:hypothetical protein J3Q64DRAFT_1766763 [Phycomyces blakesleeanus]|uniref:Protein kinase domain-containing protein n=2 Tax=Phycomyces blakesleeanus TaxID=4837 RepID=A0ABR3AM35_PHYBL